MTVQWSPQQDAALKKVGAWLFQNEAAGRYSGAPQVFYLFGYAGTGKTTLAIEVANMCKGRVLFAAFTGKAALVMMRKGCHGASTLHRLIYNHRTDPITGEAVFRLKSQDECELTTADLLIVDECSMVGEELGLDVLSFGCPVLVIGDPAQLPPIRGAGFFTENVEPDVMLTEIHRQAKDNPIVRLATEAREGRRLKLGTYEGPNGHGVIVMKRDDLGRKRVMAAEQVLVGLNRTRREVNEKIRRLKYEGVTLGPLPILGDRLVCLKNKHDRGLLNGSLWSVAEISDRARDAKKPGRSDIVYACLQSLDEPDWDHVDVQIPHNFFLGTEGDLNPKVRQAYDEFDYGYALTTHKAQGSQWNDVLVFDEGFAFKEFRDRWLYTALTRAAERAVIVQH